MNMTIDQLLKSMTELKRENQELGKPTAKNGKVPPLWN
jgi:hypothetical protein